MLLLRTIREGFLLFQRKKIISFANLFIFFLLTFFIFIGILSYYFFDESIKYVKERLDFAIYFKGSADKNDILKLKSILENMQGVDKVIYVTKETALADFQKKFISNPVIVKALNELKVNPFVDYLIVRADKVEAYREIANYLEISPYRAIIDFLTYSENKKAVDRFISFSNQLRGLVLIFLLLIIFFSFLIIFNLTILSIYSQKDEIEIFRLIGAPSYFIKLPIIFSTLISAFLGFLLAEFSMILILIRTRDIWSRILYTFNPEFFLYSYFGVINLGILSFLVISSILSTSIALYKYLKI